MREFVYQRDGKHPRHELLAHRRIEADEQHGEPWKRGVEQVVERHVRGVPGAEPRPHQVERDLVREEHRRQAVAEDEAVGEPPVAPPRPLEQRRDPQVAGEAGAEERFAGRHDEEDQQRLDAGPADRPQQLPREERAVRPGRVEAVRRHRQLVERHQDEEPERQRREQHREAPVHVAPAPLAENYHQCGEQGEHDAERRDQRRGVVGRAQPLIPLRPRVRHLEVLLVTGGLVAVHLDLHPVGGVLHLPPGPLVGERPVAPVRAVLALRLDERQFPRVQLERGSEERLGGGAGRRLVQRGPAGLLGDQVGEPHHLAFRRDLDPHLLLGQRPVPAVRPAPQPHLPFPRQNPEPVEPYLALEVYLGPVIDAEDRRMAATRERRRGGRRVLREERRRDRFGGRAVHREREVRLGERPREVRPGKDPRPCRHRHGHRQGQPFATGEPVHVASSQPPGIQVAPSSHEGRHI